MGDNKLFCVIFQKNGNGLKAIYHGQISGEGVSRVIGSSGSGSDSASVGASGNSLPNFNLEHFKNATFTDTGDITIQGKTINNPFQNFDVSKLDENKKQRLQELFVKSANEMANANSDADKAKVTGKLMNAFGNEIPEAKEFMNFATQLAGKPGVASGIGGLAKLAQPFAKTVTKLALSMHPEGNELNQQQKDTLNSLVDSVSNVVANNTKGIVEGFVEGGVAIERMSNVDAADQKNETDAAAAAAADQKNETDDEATPKNKNAETNVDSTEKAADAKREEDEAARQEAERLATREAERVAAEDAARQEAKRVAAEEAARQEAERLATEKAARQEAAAAADDKKNTERPAVLPGGGRRTKRKSKHHRRRKNKSKNKKR